MDLKGKVAVITGAARGLGKCVMQTLLKNGAKFCGLDVSWCVCVRYVSVNTTNGEATRQEYAGIYGDDNVIFKQCDVCKEDELKSVFEMAKSSFGQIDILINNAAITDESQWEKIIDVNLCGYIRGTYIAIDYMRKDKGGNGGVIINVASVAGFAPSSQGPVYTTSKHGIIGFSRTMALRPEVNDNGIRVTCLCPNIIETPLVRQTLDTMKGWDHFMLKRLIDAIGYLSVEEVAEGVLKLLNDQDNNGGVLYVDNKDGLGYKTDDNPVAQRFIAPQIL